MKKAIDFTQILVFKKTISLILLFLGSYGYAAEEEINKKPILTCEYGWKFGQGANRVIEGSLEQKTQKISVTVEENNISLLEKNNPFQGSNMLKVFNNLPSCQSHLNCKNPGEIYMMSVNLLQTEKNKYLNLNLCIFGSCITSADYTEPYSAELRIEDHGNIGAKSISPYMPPFFLLKCFVK